MNQALRSFDGIVKALRIDGAPFGLLTGTTFVAKDLYDVRGYKTGAGNPDWESRHDVAAATAPAIERLLAAGATLVGKSCTDELAFSLDGINIHYGTPLNPQFPDRLPGGSSSGSASAVAAGLVDFALGTDTSGSIRVPASYCGLYGFRPSHGAVPMRGVVPLAPSFDTVGWLAREPGMLARAGRVLLGELEDTDDSGAAADFTTLYVVEDAFEAADGRFMAGLRTAQESLQGRFADVCYTRLTSDAFERWLITFRTLKQWEAWQVHGPWIRASHPDLAPDIRENFESASRVTDDQRRRALLERERLLSGLRPYLTREAVMCLPSTWSIAPLKTASAEDLQSNRVKNLTLGSVASLAGVPQVSIPVATDAYAIGLSFIAGRGEDVRLLELAESVLVGPVSRMIGPEGT